MAKVPFTNEETVGTGRCGVRPAVAAVAACRPRPWVKGDGVRRRATSSGGPRRVGRRRPTRTAGQGQDDRAGAGDAHRHHADRFRQLHERAAARSPARTAPARRGRAAGRCRGSPPRGRRTWPHPCRPRRPPWTGGASPEESQPPRGPDGCWPSGRAWSRAPRRTVRRTTSAATAAPRRGGRPGPGRIRRKRVRTATGTIATAHSAVTIAGSGSRPPPARWPPAASATMMDPISPVRNSRKEARVIVSSPLRVPGSGNGIQILLAGPRRGTHAG